MRLFLASHHRRHPHGLAINAASRIAHPGPGVHRKDRHSTHVYVVARTQAGVCLRLDGDVPRATFGPWGRDFGVPVSGDDAPMLWEVDSTQRQRAAFLRLAHERPVYDPSEIAVAALAAWSALLPAVPPHQLARLPADAFPAAMICTRVASEVLGLPVDSMFPEALCRAVDASFPRVPRVTVDAPW